MHVNGVDLTYIQEGDGPTLILLHGGMGDYSSWDPQMAPFAARFKVIAYSRRYSFPNVNRSISKDYSPFTDVEDVAALIRALGLSDVRLVGQSIGGYIALAFALKHPGIVHALVLSEPPAHQLVRNTPAGEAAYQEFFATVWNPARAHFEQHDVQGAMKIFVNGMAGSERFDYLPAAARADVLRNARALQAQTSSSDPFPVLAPELLRALRVPTLVVTSEKAITLHRLVNDELVRQLPQVKSVVIPNAGHGSPRENAPAFNKAVLDFF